LGGPRSGAGSSFKKDIGVISSKIQNFVETNLDQNYEIIFWVKAKT
jgi:hypothetical protein